MPHLGVQLLSRLSHFNTSDFNQINPDLQQRAQSGLQWSDPSAAPRCPSLPSVKSISSALFISFRHILLPSSAQNSLQWDHCVSSRAQPQSRPRPPRLSTEARTQMPFPGRTSTGRGARCQGQGVGLAPEQGLKCNRF